MSIEDKDKLEKLLSYHDNLYYNNDDPEISDLEYDSIKNKYVSLYGEYNYVPGKASSLFEKVTHEHPVLSLQKVQSVDEEGLRDKLTKLMPVVIQPKFDGLTLVINDVVSTRGNGEIGENVTQNALTIKGINRYIKTQHTFRGEALIKKSKFIELNKERVSNGLEPFKNPRNAAAGMLRNKDSAKVEGLSLFLYDILNTKISAINQLNLIDDNAYHDVYCTPSYRFEDVESTMEFIKTFNREDLDYEIDGLVVKADGLDTLTKFGTTSGYPLNAFAIKFPSQGEWTKLNSITYQIGRTGKITPVAEIEPVDILGSTISRVTLHNEGIMSVLDIKNNCDVFVVKANDVIPAIIEARGGNKSFKEVIECPSCQSKLEKINDQSFCRNISCPEKLITAIKHMGRRDALDIKGLSDSTALKLVSLNIKNPEDIFDLTKEQIITMEGFADKSAENLYNAIQSKKEGIHLNRFMYAAGLPNVGRTASKDIANKLGSLDAVIKDIENGFPEISQIEGIGEVIMSSLHDYSNLFKELRDKITPLSVILKTVNDKALSIVITGSFMDGDRKVSRQEIQEKVEALGHKVSGSVSKNTDIVLAGEKAGSKLDKAKALGLKVFEDLDSFYASIIEGGN